MGILKPKLWDDSDQKGILDELYQIFRNCRLTIDFIEKDTVYDSHFL